MLTGSSLFVSLLWGSIGAGYFIYGKKQASWPAMIGGIMMMAVSYFASSWLMSACSAAIILAVWYLIRRGH